MPWVPDAKDAPVIPPPLPSPPPPPEEEADAEEAEAKEDVLAVPWLTVREECC